MSFEATQWKLAALKMPPGLSAKDAPATWIDSMGRAYKVSRAKKWQDVSVIQRVAMRELVFARDGAQCRVCAADGPVLCLDHILAVCNGGAHHPSNMQVLCDVCNSRKANLIDKRLRRSAV
jgi:5-methylcytosine-specific restriction endonuclease McrA